MKPMHSVEVILLLLFLSCYVKSDHAIDQCYCLKKELSGLRSAVAIEPVRIDGEDVYLISEQIGIIHKYNPNTPGSKLSTFIDLSDIVEIDPQGIFDENGLLGIAAHPNYANNTMLYVYSVRRINEKNYVVISEIKGNAANGEKILLLIEQPGIQRKGGQLLFGLDGFLYAFIGDGLNGTETDSNAQDGADLLGKVLRLDVDKLTVADYKLQYYDIPSDNPQKTGWRPEVYATGFRNPWRCSIDTGDSRGRIFCGDLGDATSDEISIIQSGGNYGFPLKEGTTCIENETLCANIADEVLPIYSFNRSAGPISAVIGGPVYRGAQFTSLQQQLMFGDFISGSLYSLQENVAADNSSQWMLHNLTECDPSKCGCDYRSHRLRFLLSFGTTFSGELMILMTDGMQPADPNTVLLSLKKPESTTPTCGSSGVAISSFLAMVMIFISLLTYWERE